jgi:hypothetical protein
MIIVR